ncbi:hypothetical protein R6Z07F_016633 [Ovis aries]
MAAELPAVKPDRRCRPGMRNETAECKFAAVAAAAAAGASDWVSGSGTGANQRGQRTGGARHGVHLAVL